MGASPYFIEQGCGNAPFFKCFDFEKLSLAFFVSAFWIRNQPLSHYTDNVWGSIRELPVFFPDTKLITDRPNSVT